MAACVLLGVVVGGGCDINRNCHGGFHRAGAGTTPDRTAYRWKVWTDRWCEYSGQGVLARTEEPYFLVPEVAHGSTLFVLCRTPEALQPVFGSGEQVSREVERHLVDLQHGGSPSGNYNMVLDGLRSLGLTRWYFSQTGRVSASWQAALKEHLGGDLLGTSVHLGAGGDRYLRLAWTMSSEPDPRTGTEKARADFVLPPVRPVRVLLHDGLAVATYWDQTERKVFVVAIEEQTGIILWSAASQITQRQGRLVMLSATPHVAGPYVVVEVDGQFESQRSGGASDVWYEKGVWVVGLDAGSSLAFWPLEKGINFGRHNRRRPGLHPWPAPSGPPPRLVMTHETTLYFYSVFPWAITPDDELDLLAQASTAPLARPGPRVRSKDRYALLVSAVDAISGSEKWFRRVPLTDMFRKASGVSQDTPWTACDAFDPFVMTSGTGFDPRVPTTDFLPLGGHHMAFVAGSFPTGDTDGPACLRTQHAVVATLDLRSGQLGRMVLIERGGLGFARLYERNRNVIVCSTNTIVAFSSQHLTGIDASRTPVASTAQGGRSAPRRRRRVPARSAEADLGPQTGAPPKPKRASGGGPAYEQGTSATAVRAPEAGESAAASHTGRKPTPTVADPLTPPVHPSAPRRVPLAGPSNVRAPAGRATRGTLPVPSATRPPLRVRLNPPRWSAGRPAPASPRSRVLPPRRADLRRRSVTPLTRERTGARPRFQLLPQTRPTTRPTRLRRRRRKAPPPVRKLPPGLVPYADPE